MTDQSAVFSTPVGRIVWGHPTKAKGKTYGKDHPQKGQPIIDPKTGVQAVEWSFGVAYPKSVFDAEIRPWLDYAARLGYPNGVPARFSWKIVDGDGVDGTGALYSTREGYAGCYVLAISTQLKAPGLFKFNGATYDQLTPEQIKCGDFVSVNLNVKPNVPPAGSTNTPSLYVNPEAVEFIGYGTEIVGTGGVDPMTAFGGTRHALPPGASATPVGGGAGVTMPGTTPVAPAVVRPTDPTHIHAAGTAGEQWWINGQWVPAVSGGQAPTYPGIIPQ